MGAFVSSAHLPSIVAVHGCPRCYLQRDERLPRVGKTPQEMFARTQDRVRYLELQGFTVVTMWQCELVEARKRNPDMDAFMRSVPLVEPLNVRDAFFGGRTDVLCMHRCAQEDEEINYADVCSLYPFICSTGRSHCLIFTHFFRRVSARPPDRVRVRQWRAARRRT